MDVAGLVVKKVSVYTATKDKELNRWTQEATQMKKVYTYRHSYTSEKDIEVYYNIWPISNGY